MSEHLSERTCVSVDLLDGRAVLRVAGAIELSSAGHLEHALNELAANGILRFTVDLAGVTSMDDAGIDVLRQFMRGHPMADVRLTRATPAVRSLCWLAAIDDRLVGA